MKFSSEGHPFLEKIQKISLALWLGSLCFFSFVIAPTVFKVLEKSEAARLQNVLFPKYYLLGVICGILLFLLNFFSHNKRKSWMIILATILSLIGLVVLSPMIREAYTLQLESMKWLHPLAVFLNLILMILLLILV
jgi:NAD/NADP transhydrogenase beta subunit